MENLIVIGFLLVFIGFIMVLHFVERKALLDRLMARDLPELVLGEIERKKASVPHKIIRQEGIPI